MHKHTKGRISVSSKRSHMKINLKSGFRTIRIYPLNRNKVLKQLPKTILEEKLRSMMERERKVFLEELEKKMREITKCWVIKNAKNWMSSRNETLVLIMSKKPEEVMWLRRGSDVITACIDNKEETFLTGRIRTKINK